MPPPVCFMHEAFSLITGRDNDRHRSSPVIRTLRHRLSNPFIPYGHLHYYYDLRSFWFIFMQALRAKGAAILTGIIRIDKHNYLAACVLHSGGLSYFSCLYLTHGAHSSWTSLEGLNPASSNARAAILSVFSLYFFLNSSITFRTSAHSKVYLPECFLINPQAMSLSAISFSILLPDSVSSRALR